MIDSSYWRKSSYSVNDGDCIELSRDSKFIRDSKDPSGPVLAVDVASFVRAVRDGRFER